MFLSSCLFYVRCFLSLYMWPSISYCLNVSRTVLRIRSSVWEFFRIWINLISPGRPRYIACPRHMTVPSRYRHDTNSTALLGLHRIWLVRVKVAVLCGLVMNRHKHVSPWTCLTLPWRLPRQSGVERARSAANLGVVYLGLDDGLAQTRGWHTSDHLIQEWSPGTKHGPGWVRKKTKRSWTLQDHKCRFYFG